MYRPPRAIKNSVSITSIPSATPNESDTMTKTHDDEIVHRELNTDREEPAVAVAEIVAELEGKHADELTTTYACIDGMISELYSNPPSPEADDGRIHVQRLPHYHRTERHRGVRQSYVTAVGRIPDHGSVSTLD
jgi:hypothetical protein